MPDRLVAANTCQVWKMFKNDINNILIFQITIISVDGRLK